MFTLRQSIPALISLALIVGLAAAFGYGVGIGVGAGPRMSETKVFRDIPTFVGDGVMTALVDDVAYGVAGEVAWVDASGSGMGAVVHGPTGVGEYRMLWVDCRT